MAVNLPNELALMQFIISFLVIPLSMAWMSSIICWNKEFDLLMKPTS